MYEDYLEEFIFKTAKLIAKKLFGKNTDDENEAAVEDPSTNPSDDLITNINTESEEVTEENSPNVEENNEEAKNDEPDENEFEILEKQQKPSEDCVEKVDDPDYGENLKNIFKKTFFYVYKMPIIDPEVERELEKLILETKEKYSKIEQDKMKTETMTRAEYDAIHDGISSINFHLTLFLLLTILAVLNVPSVITWANDYQ